ncbi:metallophosphoesterase [Paenibacillus xylaniclasticus]|uniref:metallophosphoesterase n=1 Tax=Paenibacillus xylaniclasticus TaxID=588083 RepID=UPI000FDCD017|nr:MULTISPECIES: metallophosphoesterase [Paenibacillus]GFN31532.1 hypothetical protein PCURB6_17920 [Paenibacillus curdlanolyticus]
MTKQAQRLFRRLVRLTSVLIAVYSMMLAFSVSVGAAVHSAQAAPDEADRYATVQRSAGFDLVFPVISDIHIGRGAKAEKKLEDVLKQINQITPQYDAIASVGDLTNDGTVSQYDRFMRIYNRYRQPQAQHLLAIGNHDYWGNPREAKGRKLFIAKTGMKNIYYDKWINGYHFIVIGSENKSVGGTLSDTQLKWLDEKLSEHAKANKPIFVFFHQHIGGTVSGSDLWGHSRSHMKLYATLARYPQVIIFSGHSHYMLDDPRTIHQRHFTSVGISSIRYPELEPGKVQGKHPSDDIAQGCIVYVKRGKVTIRRRDFHRNDWTGEDWVIPYPASRHSFVYTDDRDRIKPIFPTSASVSIVPDSIGATKAALVFDQATDNLFVHAYDIEVKRQGSRRSTLKLSAFSEFYKRPVPASITVELKGLKPEQNYTASVYAVDSFGNRSAKPLTVSFRTRAITNTKADQLSKLLSL